MKRQHRNAIVILRAATYRSRGYRAWGPGGHFAKLMAPSRNNMRWFELKWKCLDCGRGIDIGRHRLMAKDIACRLIAAWQAAGGEVYASEATWEKTR